MYFSGIWPAITTPFTSDGHIHRQELEASVHWLVNAGVHGLVVTGTMGEFRSLTAEERRVVIETTVEAAGGRSPVVVGISADSGLQAAGNAQAAASLGAFGVMSLPPLSYHADTAELVAFFEEVAGATNLPLMIYNNPSGSKNDLDPATLNSLAEIENVVAVKETSEDVRRIAMILELTGGRLEVLVGGDDWALEGLCAGASGWVSGCAVVVPVECVRLHALIMSGRLEEALALYRRLLPLARLDMDPKLVQLFKAAMDQVGRYGGPSRLPRLPLTPAETARVTGALKHFDATHDLRQQEDLD